MSDARKPGSVARPPRMFNVVQDTGTGEYLIPTRALQAAQHRFRTLLERATAELPGHPDAAVAACCGLALFESPGSPADLKHMIKAAGDADLAAKPALIYWHRNGLLHCRELSAETLSLMRGCILSGCDADANLARMRQQLGAWYPLPNNAADADLLDWIVNDGVAWAWEHQYGPVLADLHGDHRIEPLPPAVIARATRPTAPAGGEFSLSKRSRTVERLSDVVIAGMTEGPANQRRAYLVDDLVTAFGCESHGSPRRANSRQAGNVFRALARLAADLPDAHPCVAVPYGWTLFMLIDGTARTRAANIGTARLYCQNLACSLFHALLRTKLHPLEMTEEHWSGLIRELLIEDSSQTRRSAVAALLKYLRAYFGAEIRVRAGSVEVVPHVAANVIWNSELMLALQLLEQVEPDERLRLMVRAVYDIARRVPIRYGELSSLRLRSIRKLDVAGKCHLEIEIAPSRALHGGKSRAARRVARLGLASQCGAIVELLQRRTADGAALDDLLLGDPQRGERLYCAGRLSMLVHGLLRSATGDQEVSFHTLRHTVLTALVSEAMCEPDVTRRQLLLDRATEAAGHKSVSTTVAVYFHLPSQSLRRKTDAALVPLFSRPVVQRAWAARLGRGQTQRCFELAATAADMRNVSLEPSQRSAGGRAADMPLDRIRGTLRDIRAGRPLSEVTSRSGLSGSELLKLAAAAEQVALTLGRTPSIRGLGLERRNPEEALKDASKAVRALPISFDPCGVPPHAGVWRRLGNARQSDDAVAAWLRCYQKGWLSLEEHSDFEPLVSFLAQSKTPASHLEIRYASKGGDVLTPTPSSQAALCVHVHFGSSVPEKPVDVRAGRPSTYLIVARDCVLSDHRTPAASCRMDELHGAFFSYAVQSIINRSR